MTSNRPHYTQSGRMMAIETRLGEDTLLLYHLDIDERINALFAIKADVKAQRDDLDPADLIGSTVDFRLHLKDGGTRWWNGFVTHMHEGKLTTRGTRSYGFTIRPRLWLLSQRSDCRIFQNQTTPQIIETLLQEHGISDYQLRITSKIEPQVYSVQWNETDLDYMLRRMQQDGLFYWHDFEEGRHILVVGDHYSAYGASQEPDVRYSEGSPAQDHISSWTRTFAFTPGRRSGRDWNFETMQSPGGEQGTFAQVPGNADHELYEFPGRFLDSSSAEQAMKSRIQATESGFETVEAISTVRTLAPGQTFTPRDVAKPDNRFARQVVVAIKHVADDPTYETGAGQPAYDNTLSVMPATTPATPHRYQRRPRINGQQIALIAGPPGEEIFCDQYGRVKVWFPWDRRAVKDGSDTCWIRVGQPWAGTSWGHQVIPRVGMEALVSYQEGDPDRPFIMALVPDTTNTVPYDLPDNKTRMVVRSDTYKGDGFNEMYMEDFSAWEEIYTRAQRDMNTHVLNNASHRIENHSALSVGMNRSVEIGNLDVESVGGNKVVKVGPISALTELAASTGFSSSPLQGMSYALEQDQYMQPLPGTYTLQCDAEKLEGVGGSSIENVGGSKITTVKDSYTLNVAGTSRTSVSSHHSLSVGDMHVTTVAGTNEVNVGGSHQMNVGKAKFVINSDGSVELSGTTLTIKFSGDIKINGQKIYLNG